MSLTNLELLRLRIADRARLILHETIGIGDGLSLGFQSGFYPIAADTESVVIVSTGLSTVLVQNQDYTLDYELGLLVLANAPPVDDQVQMSYQWVTFTDDELNGILQVNGDNVTAAAIMCIEMILVDSERFIKYTFGQDDVDRAESRQAILDTLEQLRKYQGGAVGIVVADTAYLKCLMAPFLEQDCEDV